MADQRDSQVYLQVISKVQAILSPVGLEAHPFKVISAHSRALWHIVAYTALR